MIHLTYLDIYLRIRWIMFYKIFTLPWLLKELKYWLLQIEFIAYVPLYVILTPKVGLGITGWLNCFSKFSTEFLLNSKLLLQLLWKVWCISGPSHLSWMVAPRTAQYSGWGSTNTEQRRIITSLISCLMHFSFNLPLKASVTQGLLNRCLGED